MPSFFPPYSPYSKRLHVLMVFLFLVIHTQAQDPIIRVTEALKPNVVAIQTTFADGSAENGFGFITGEKNGQLYLVTAGHVVHGREAKTPQKIQVRFYSSLRQYEAEEEYWFEADDLSLLTLPKPATLQWKPAFAYYSPQNRQTVRFVGKNKDWISPGTGEIFRLSKDRIEFTMYSLEPGCSGAPLIGENGIIGLILQDERASSVALHLTRIRELIGDARFPYFSAELYNAAAVLVPSNGDPNSKNLEGITTGTGSVGGSLGNRNVLSAPRITDNSALEGTVVIAVCVDAYGSVVSADFTQKGSTTSNSTLVNLAVNNARKWKFSTGDVDMQCGTMTYRFKVQ